MRPLIDIGLTLVHYVLHYMILNMTQNSIQYQRAVEIFSESVPQTLSAIMGEFSLYLSLGISTFNLLVNAYKFRKEAKIHGLSIAEYALSVLQFAEIPISRLVPRLPLMIYFLIQIQ